MILTDYHIHSRCSPDAGETMADMALAARAHGITHLCFTDHCDLDNYLTGQPEPSSFDFFPHALEDFAAAKAAVGDTMDLRLGLELGEANHDIPRAAAIAATPELDFIIGSTHNLLGIPDFYGLEYTSEEQCLSLLERYLAEVKEVAATGLVDVLGHIGYTRRYMSKAGFDIRVGMDNFGDAITDILKTAIEKGVGIEVNCASLRNAHLAETIPGLDILVRYRELGGELITVGSDAHTTADAGVGCAQGQELLRQAGFAYVTLFRGRKPEFIKL